MPRQEGLRPIGESVKKIIEKIKKEREERQKKSSSPRTQPKLPGMKRGGGVDMGDPKKPVAIPTGKDPEIMVHNLRPSDDPNFRAYAAPKKRRRYFVGQKPDKDRRYAATPGNLPKPAIGKMGGGMMQRPMGYKSGTMVKARGCKLGRTRPTKMY